MDRDRGRLTQLPGAARGHPGVLPRALPAERRGDGVAAAQSGAGQRVPALPRTQGRRAGDRRAAGRTGRGRAVDRTARARTAGRAARRRPAQRCAGTRCRRRSRDRTVRAADRRCHRAGRGTGAGRRRVRDRGGEQRRDRRAARPRGRRPARPAGRQLVLRAGTGPSRRGPHHRAAGRVRALARHRRPALAGTAAVLDRRGARHPRRTDPAAAAGRPGRYRRFGGRPVALPPHPGPAHPAAGRRRRGDHAGQLAADRLLGTAAARRGRRHPASGRWPARAA